MVQYQLHKNQIQDFQASGNKIICTAIQNNNFRHRNNRNNFNKGFQNNFDRRNHLENENPLWRLRKQPLELQGDEEHEDIPENIPEDSLVDILAAVHSRTSSTETIIVPETQQTNESFLLQTPSH